jgi:energy-coupling factor transporter transmembrane protein EcfT
MWSVKYFLLIFVGVVGILQLAAARNDWKGFYFFPWRSVTAVFGAVLLVFTLTVLFTWNEFNTRIIEGSQQTGSFVISGAAAVIFTAVLSSLLNIRRMKSGAPPAQGMDALQSHTFIQAFGNSSSRKPDDR